MSIPEVFDRVFDATVRLEAAWPFPVLPAPDSLGEALEMFEELPPELAPLAAGFDEDGIFLFDGHGYEFQEAWSELCAAGFRRGLHGWIGVAATPVFRPSGYPGSATFSWGHYRHGLIFAATADALLERAVEWAEKTQAADMARGDRK